MDEPRPKIDRRRVLIGLGSTATALGISGRAGASTLHSATGRADSELHDSTPATASEAARTLDLDTIQGNIVSGFHQHHQAMILVAFTGAETARRWVTSIIPSVTPATEVELVRDRFRAGDEVANSTWVNVALSHSGLEGLGRPDAELETFPRAFRAGMAARARRIGDTGDNAPANWPAPFQERFDGVVIVAADDPAELDAEVDRQRDLATSAGVTVVHVERGDARADEPGHEHFGFRDGISQPGLRGFTAQQNPADDGQGLPGQDLLWPGEFVLGHPRQGGVGAGDDPGPLSRSGPDWTADGSYLVFRRLTQDVQGFRTFVTEMATTQDMSEDLAGAKLVGRYKSGAPLTVAGEQATDPGAADPSMLEDLRSNDFEFEDDFDGAVVPLAAHIRKTYPRDQPTDDGGEEDTQLHRLLRRGIPFGGSLSGTENVPPVFPDDRGLLFLAYQWSIERQFEHVQRQWVNDPDFPEDDAGRDPVIAQSTATGGFTLPGGRPDHVAVMQRFVTTTGGEYFFQPSIAALTLLAEPSPGVDAEPTADRRERIPADSRRSRHDQRGGADPLPTAGTSRGRR